MPSANELAWFYKRFRQSARPGAFPKRESSRSVSFPIQRTRVTWVTRDVLSRVAKLRSVAPLASDVCAENFSHSARLLLQLSRASFMIALCLRAVLISSPDTWVCTRMHALAVMHRWTLYENVDSAKIKVPFYTTDINILRMASMHHIVIHRIDISMNRYTPT